MRWFVGFLGMLVAACGVPKQPPEIARDLPSNYAEGEKVFNARLAKRFPIGSAEDAAVDELARQGFEVSKDADGIHATFNDGSPIVQSVWNVGWDAEDGKITRIWGVYGGRGP